MAGHLLQSIPPLAVYLIVGLTIMVESLGIPVPGEIALVTAAVLATQHKTALSPAWIAACGSAGAIVGDSIGFLIGRRAGQPLFARLGRRFPRHFGPGHIAVAERVFTRHGVWAVFFGRFIALLRIFAGPLAGSLRMPYGRFLAANACGGIAWATGMTYLIWFLGVAAERWLTRFSWLALIAAVAAGVAITLLVRRKTAALVWHAEAEAPAASARAGQHTGPGRDEPARQEPARQEPARQEAVRQEADPKEPGWEEPDPEEPGWEEPDREEPGGEELGGEEPGWQEVDGHEATRHHHVGRHQAAGGVRRPGAGD